MKFVNEVCRCIRWLTFVNWMKNGQVSMHFPSAFRSTFVPTRCVWLKYCGQPEESGTFQVVRKQQIAIHDDKH